MGHIERKPGEKLKKFLKLTEKRIKVGAVCDNCGEEFQFKKQMKLHKREDCGKNKEEENSILIKKF